MALTPEEQKELESLQAELGEVAPEEEAELQSKLDLAGDVDQQLEAQGFEISQEEASTMDKIGAAVLGGAQGLLQENFDEALASVSAVVDKVNNPTLSLGEAYRSNKNDIDATLTEAEKDVPLAFGSGEMIGSVGSAFLPGGVGAKLAGATLKSAAMVGFLRGVGKAENLKLDPETAMEIAQEVGVESLGFGTGKLLSKGVKLGRGLKQTGSLKNITDEIEFARKRSNALLDTIGVSGKANLKKFEKDVLLKRGVTHDQFMADMLEDLAVKGDETPLQIERLIREKKNDLWTNQIEPIFDNVDEIIPQGAIKASELRDRLLNDLGLSEQFIGKSQDEIANIVKKVIPEALVTTESRIGFRLAEAQNLLNRVKNTAVNSKTKKVIDRSIRSVMEETVEANLGSAQKKTFKELKRRYGNLAESMDFVIGSKAEYREALRKFDESTTSLWQRITSLADLAKPGAQGKTVGRFVDILKNKAPLDFAPSKRLADLNKMADRIVKDPDRYNALVRRTVQASARSVDEFVENMGLLNSITELDANPMKKEMVEIDAKSDHIINVLKELDPMLSHQFQKALRNGDEMFIMKMINAVSKLPEAQRFFIDDMPGVTNMQGQRLLLDPIDQQKARNIINASQIGTLQGTMAHEIIDSGVMPPLPPEEPPFQKPTLMRPRLKDRKRDDI